MARFSRAQCEARRRIEQLSGSGLEPLQFAARLMEALSVALPNDGYRLFAVDPATLLINRLLAASADDDWARLEWLQNFYLVAQPMPYSEMTFLMRHNLNAIALQERQSESWGLTPDVLGGLDGAGHYRAYHAIRSPRGGVLVGCFGAAGRWVGIAQVYRREGKMGFRKSDVDFLRSVAPLVGRSVAAALERERALTSPDRENLNSAGVLVVQPDGALSFETTTGAAWRELLAIRDGAETGGLPAAVWTAIARARTDSASLGQLQVRYPDVVLRIEASPASPEDDAFAVVLQPETRPDAPEIPPAWGLTPQERRIAVMVLCGMTNRQIGEAVSVTENTVETHLRHIYEKLDIGSRNQLSARYFQEVFRPGLLGPAAEPSLPGS